MCDKVDSAIARTRASPHTSPLDAVARANRSPQAHTHRDVYFARARVRVSRDDVGEDVGEGVAGAAPIVVGGDVSRRACAGVRDER